MYENELEPTCPKCGSFLMEITRENVIDYYCSSNKCDYDLYHTDCEKVEDEYYKDL